MAESIQEVMTPHPFLADVKTSVAEAARVMKDADVGSLIVLGGEAVRGMVTDRDIVIRVVAEGRDAGATALGEICSQEPIMVSLRDTVEAAVEMMQTHAVRRLPVVDEDGRAVGIVSLGDLAVELDRGSALGDISAAPPKR
jgi:CBS domain-containing protein